MSVTAILFPDITIAGQALAEHDQQRVVSIVINQVLSCPSQCELIFMGNSCPANIGAALKLSIDNQVVFAGTVSACRSESDQRGEHYWALRAYDGLLAAARHQEQRVFVNQSASSIAQTIAGNPA